MQQQALRNNKLRHSPFNIVCVPRLSSSIERRQIYTHYKKTDVQWFRTRILQTIRKRSLTTQTRAMTFLTAYLKLMYMRLNFCANIAICGHAAQYSLWACDPIQFVGLRPNIVCGPAAQYSLWASGPTQYSNSGPAARPNIVCGPGPAQYSQCEIFFTQYSQPKIGPLPNRVICVPPQNHMCMQYEEL